MNAINYLDDAKKKLGIESDYALGKTLDISANRISALRNGRSVGFDEEMSIKIGDVLGIDPLIVIADMKLAKPRANREFWEGVKSKAGHAAVVMAIASASIMPIKSEAYGHIGDSAVICIMRVSQNS